MFLCRSGRQTPLSTYNSLQQFDPCTYHRSNLASFVNSFSEMQLRLLRLVEFLPCSAASRNPHTHLLSSSGCHWVAPSNSELLAEPPPRRVPPRRVDFSPCHIRSLPTSLMLSLIQFPLLVVHVSFLPLDPR